MNKKTLKPRLGRWIQILGPALSTLNASEAADQNRLTRLELPSAQQRVPEENLRPSVETLRLNGNTLSADRPATTELNDSHQTNIVEEKIENSNQEAQEVLQNNNKSINNLSATIIKQEHQINKLLSVLSLTIGLGKKAAYWKKSRPLAYELVQIQMDDGSVQPIPHPVPITAAFLLQELKRNPASHKELMNQFSMIQTYLLHSATALEDLIDQAIDLGLEAEQVEHSTSSSE